jgi:hypothetical protein
MDSFELFCGFILREYLFFFPIELIGLILITMRKCCNIQISCGHYHTFIKIYNIKKIEIETARNVYVIYI